MNNISKTSVTTLAIFLSSISFTMIPKMGHSETAENALHRVNIAGRQRMLSQHIAGLACITHLEHEAALHGQETLEALDLYTETLTLLRDGSAESGLGIENNPKILVDIAKAVDGLETMTEILAPLSNGGEIDLPHLSAISAASNILTETSAHVITEIQTAYSGELSDLTLIETMIINFAGRQRSLSEKAFKEFCFVEAGVNTATNLEELAQTIELFDNTMAALINGMQGLILPPPTEEIKAKLIEANTVWLAAEDFLKRAIAGEQFDEETILKASEEFTKVRLLMDEAVLLYQQAS